MIMITNRRSSVLSQVYLLRYFWACAIVFQTRVPVINGRGGSVSACYRHHNLTEGAIINRLLDNYKKGMPETEGPVSVRIEMRIQQVSALNELTRDFEIEVLFSQLWHDPAFSFDHLSTCKKNITMETSLLERIWTPNTCVINSKKATVHASPYDNTMFILYENGSIWVNYRMQVRAPCDLNLRSFPFDTHRCKMKFASYTYNNEEVQLRWLDRFPITLADKNAIDLPDFRLVGWSARNVSRDYQSGKWDGLQVTLVFKRRYGFFVLQALTIIVSWVSFSMNSEIKALPARSTVGVSCLLALTFQIGNIFANLPRVCIENSAPVVSYVKAMDVWMLGCITFVFGTIVELAVVCSLNKYGRSKSSMILSRKGPVFSSYPSKYLFPTWSPTGKRGSPQQAARPRALAGLDQPIRSPSPTVPLEVYLRQNNPARGSCICNGQAYWPRSARYFHWSHIFTSDKIDRLSMLLFPCGFTVFNIFYWSYYLSQAYAHEKELIEEHGIILV